MWSICITQSDLVSDWEQIYIHCYLSLKWCFQLDADALKEFSEELSC